MKMLSGWAHGPWLCFADFNEIIANSEKRGGRVHMGSQMRGFRDAIDFCRLKGIDSEGPLFTWSNFQEGDALIEERLDRFLATPDWLSMFPHATVDNFITSHSDHHCLILNTVSSLEST